jgi:hypothetical protein
MMKTILQFLIDAMAEEIGHPRKIQRLISGNPHLIQPDLVLPKTAAASSILHLDDLTSKGTLVLSSWGNAPSYGYCGLRSQVFNDFIEHSYTPEWECDICDVEGIAHSKGNPEQYDSLDAWIKDAWPELISEISHEALEKVLAHDEIRIINSTIHSDCFARYAWDGRLFLLNAGGSHHFAAARYIAKRLKARVPLLAPLNEYAVNPSLTQKLTSAYHIFCIPDRDESGGVMAFHDALKDFKAPYLCTSFKPVRARDETASLFFFPRGDRRANRVGNLLLSHGAQDFSRHFLSKTPGAPCSHPR